MTLKQSLKSGIKKVEQVANLRAFVMACCALATAGAMSSCGNVGGLGNWDMGGGVNAPYPIYKDGSTRAQPIYDWGASQARPNWDIFGTSKARRAVDWNGASQAQPFYDGGASRAQGGYVDNTPRRASSRGAQARPARAQAAPQRANTQLNDLTHNDSATGNGGMGVDTSVVFAKKKQERA